MPYVVLDAVDHSPHIESAARKDDAGLRAGTIVGVLTGGNDVADVNPDLIRAGNNFDYERHDPLQLSGAYGT
jgi:hypothetical protein